MIDLGRWLDERYTVACEAEDAAEQIEEQQDDLPFEVRRTPPNR